MPMEKEKLQKLILVCSSTVTVTALYYNFVISGFQLSAIREMKTKIADLHTRIERADEDERKRRKLAASAEADHDFLLAQEARIVRGDQIAWLWREMGDFADRQKMPRVMVTPETPAPDGLPASEAYGRAGGSLNLACGYHRLGEFVQNLENEFPSLQIQHVEIVGGNSTSPDAHTVRLQFGLFAFREHKAKEGVAPTAEAPVIPTKKE